MTDTTVALPLIIKRYARSRLYEPGRGRYVSIDTLHAWKAKRSPLSWWTPKRARTSPASYWHRARPNIA
jgi:hypothetical protein